jgi:hypothetical protein
MHDPEDGIIFAVLGSFFVVLAVLRPRIWWEAPRVVSGRRWLGDRGYVALWLVLGLVLLARGVQSLVGLAGWSLRR